MLRGVTVFLLCVAAAVALKAENRLYAQEKFLEFTNKYNKQYAPAEYDVRFKNFQENLIRIEKHNSCNKRNHDLGIDAFSDMTKAEFESKYLMKPFSADTLKRMYQHIKVDNSTKSKAPTPSSFDWREKGAVSAVKNQGGCGSCWTYSTTGNIEGINYIKNKKLVTLSQQELVDCDHECGKDPIDGTQYCDGGCNGGWMMTAFQYVIKAGGINTEASYPGGTHQGSKCLAKPENVGAKLSAWKMLSNNEEELAQQLVENGPVSVAFNTGKLFSYRSGIISGSSCDPKVMSHAVLLVGFGEQNG